VTVIGKDGILQYVEDNDQLMNPSNPVSVGKWLLNQCVCGNNIGCIHSMPNYQLY